MTRISHSAQNMPHVLRSTSMLDAVYRIEPLSRHSNLLKTIASWHWSEWGNADPDASLQNWVNGLRARSNPAGVPSTYVAVSEQDGSPIGSVCLVVEDMDTHPELSPWLANLFVAPSFRGLGIGTALTRHAMAKASETGVETLHLYTSTATSLYEGLGWRLLFREHREGEWSDVMAYTVRRPGGVVSGCGAQQTHAAAPSN